MVSSSVIHMNSYRKKNTLPEIHFFFTQVLRLADFAFAMMPISPTACCLTMWNSSCQQIQMILSRPRKEVYLLNDVTDEMLQSVEYGDWNYRNKAIVGLLLNTHFNIHHLAYFGTVVSYMQNSTTEYLSWNVGFTFVQVSQLHCYASRLPKKLLISSSSYL